MCTLSVITEIIRCVDHCRYCPHRRTIVGKIPERAKETVQRGLRPFERSSMFEPEATILLFHVQGLDIMKTVFRTNRTVQYLITFNNGSGSLEDISTFVVEY